MVVLEVGFGGVGVMREVLGARDENLARLERAYGVEATTRGGLVRLRGEKEACERVRGVLEEMGRRSLRGEGLEGAWGITRGAGLAARARTQGQKRYAEALERAVITLATGPAGSGKTHLAVACAVSALESGEAGAVVLCRPAVSAGEDLGYLPGDAKEKVAPYLRPLVDELEVLTGKGTARGLLMSGRVEATPLGFLRGRTFRRAYVVVDEAQNCTKGQMRMALTRLGEGSRMAVAGDPGETDLPSGVASGLSDAVVRLEGVEGVEVVRLGASDVVRRGVVARVVRAYGGS